jgi:hypothetical protein
MKKLIVTISGILLSLHVLAQNVNYGREKMHKYQIGLSFSWDFAASPGIQYQYLKTNSKWRGLGVNFNLPTSENIFDDYAVSGFSDWQLFDKKHIKSFARIAVFEKKLVNTNAELNTLGAFLEPSIAYYHNPFYIGLEAKYSWSIFTKYKSTEELRQYFPEMKDGIAFKAQGQTFSAGLKTGFSIKKRDVDLGVGMVNVGHIGGVPFVPFYFRVGVSRGVY